MCKISNLIKLKSTTLTYFGEDFFSVNIFKHKGLTHIELAHNLMCSKDVGKGRVGMLQGMDMSQSV